MSRPDASAEQEALRRLLDLGLSDSAARVLLDHFVDADRRGKSGHGLARIDWLESQSFDPSATPELVLAAEGFERWHGNGALGYLVLDAVCDRMLAHPPSHARMVVVESCFPTGVLGYWARRLATAGLVAVLAATSPRRLPHPDGGLALTGTNPLAIAIPSSDGRPVVADVSMGAVTHGDVLSGRAHASELVPFGGESAHKAFALAAGIELLVGALAGADHAAVMIVAQPEHDPAPGFRALAAGLRLPGDA